MTIYRLSLQKFKSILINTIERFESYRDHGYSKTVATVESVEAAIEDCECDRNNSRVTYPVVMPGNVRLLPRSKN